MLTLLLLVSGSIEQKSVVEEAKYLVLASFINRATSLVFYAPLSEPEPLPPSLHLRARHQNRNWRCFLHRIKPTRPLFWKLLKVTITIDQIFALLFLDFHPLIAEMVI